MPKKIKDIRVLGFVLVLFAALVQPAFSKGSDIQFTAQLAVSISRLH